MLSRYPWLKAGSLAAGDVPHATGRGIRVAVIDSGCHPAHPHVGDVLPGVRIAADGTIGVDTVDRLGHGTAVAAAIREKAPDVGIVPMKVFDRELRATVVALEAAIDWAVTSGVDVINLSLGTATPEHESRLSEAVARATAAGVLLVAAAEQDGVRWLPGSLPGALGVVVDFARARDTALVAVDDSESPPRITLSASGYPRPIPGVPPERNLKGVSFAVANATGLLCRYLSSPLS